MPSSTPKQAADDAALIDRMFSATYEELRRLAASVRRDDPSETLNPTALVNAAYLKMAASPNLAPESRLHFKRIAARAMRQVLVEAARRRNAAKRGRDFAFVTFDEALDGLVAQSEDLLTLDAALEELAQVKPRLAQMIEYRFFGGYTIAETATLLDLSEATVTRDWRTTKAWLKSKLGQPKG